MEWYAPIVFGNFGWMGQLIPIVFILCVSWALTRKVREMAYIQFPITIGMKMIFPFINPNLIAGSLVLFILNLVSSNNDYLADLKNYAKKTTVYTWDLLKRSGKSLSKIPSSIKDIRDSYGDVEIVTEEMKSKMNRRMRDFVEGVKRTTKKPLRKIWETSGEIKEAKDRFLK